MHDERRLTDGVLLHIRNLSKRLLLMEEAHDEGKTLLEALDKLSPDEAYHLGVRDGQTELSLNILEVQNLINYN